MGKLTNLLAGAGAGYMQGKRMRKEEDRANKMDDVYAAIAKNMMGKTAAESASTTTPAESMAPAPVGSVGGAPYPVTPEGEQNLATGGMVGGCLPMGDRMMWQRQSFKK